jgi:hypothetical protein
MKIISSVMQSIVGCTTSNNTNGVPFTRIWLNARPTSEHRKWNPFSPDPKGETDLLANPLKNYEVCLSDEVLYILAASEEEAAWDALELSNNKHSKLLDVRLIDG